MSPTLIVILFLLIIACLIVAYRAGKWDGDYEGQKKGFKEGVFEGRKQLAQEQSIEAAQKRAEINMTPRPNRGGRQR